MASATAASCEDSSHQLNTELNRTKGFLGGTLGEVTDAVPANRSVLTEIQAMTNDVLVAAGELAMQDIGDNLLVLDELRQRFRRGVRFTGYSGWSDFVTKNSRYSLRTIQTKLAAVNGKDESKVNHNTGNMWTRDTRVPENAKPVGETSVESPATITDEATDEVIDEVPAGWRPLQPVVRPTDKTAVQPSNSPKRWHKYEREDAGGCTLKDLRARIAEVSKQFDDPFAFLGLTQEHKVPTGATQAQAIRTRQTLDIPAQWKTPDGEVHATTNVQYANGQLLNKLISAVENGETSIAVKPSPARPSQFWETLYHKINALVPSISDGAEHVTVTMLQQSITEPVITLVDRNYRQYTIRVLEQAAKDFTEYACLLREATQPEETTQPDSRAIRE